MNTNVYIIAEAGINHNGSRDTALEMVDVAVECGADAIKFQTFKTDKLVTKNAPTAEYQTKAMGEKQTQYEMLKRLELSESTYMELIERCSSRGIQFLSTAFDEESLRFLVESLDLRTLKIPSGEITNGPLLFAHAKTGRDMIISTGMATMGEIEETLGLLAYVLLGGQNPSRSKFRTARLSDEGKSVLTDRVTLLHCTSQYPAPMEDINLSALATMREQFGLKVGYSDHSEGIVVPTAAAALGAQVIEKHFTLDKDVVGPDHKASLEPDDLKAMVDAIRNVTKAIGNGCKKPTTLEFKNRIVARQSLVAAKYIAEGKKLTESNVTTKRPGDGRSPMDYWEVLNSVASKTYLVDECIS